MHISWEWEIPVDYNMNLVDEATTMLICNSTSLISLSHLLLHGLCLTNLNLRELEVIHISTSKSNQSDSWESNMLLLYISSHLMLLCGTVDNFKKKVVNRQHRGDGYRHIAAFVIEKKTMILYFSCPLSHYWWFTSRE